MRSNCPPGHADIFHISTDLMDSKSLVRVSGGMTVLLTEYKEDELLKFSSFPSLSHCMEQRGEHSTRHDIFIFDALTRAP